MAPEIIDRDEIIVVGVRTVLEVGVESAGSLWKGHFLPRKDEVKRAERRYYAVFNILPDDKSGRYEYVAGVAANTLEDIPVGMVGWVIPAGKYAEADAVGHTGIGRVCREIIADWLPDSGYLRVNSPMFAYTLDERPDSPSAEWKIDIPVETPDVLAELGTWLSDN